MNLNRRGLWLGLAAVLAVALIVRLLLLASGAVSFHSDEAVVALMARHILAGERPAFFYGQAYMGSLDSGLIALGFAVFGESVAAIRAVQSILFLAVVAATYGAVHVLSGRVRIAVVAGLTVAVPSVLMALYTTATLGGYNEVLLLGALIVLVGFPIRSGGRDLWRWALLGLLAGLGWWTNALIAVYLLPLGVLLLARMWRGRSEGVRLLIGPALALVLFAAGSAPWWAFALDQDLAPLRFLLGMPIEGYASAEISQPFGMRLIGLLAFGLPAALGLRFPWAGDWFAPLLAAPVLLVYGAALVTTIRRGDFLKPDGRGLVLGMAGLLMAVFVLSRFSNDPTGRYFLPLSLPLGVMLGVLVEVLLSPRRAEAGRANLRRAAAFGAVAVILGAHGLGQVTAARGPVGLTTQFNVAEHIPVGYDEAVIAFLQERGITHGYSSYWPAFRLAFLSGETVTLSPSLPPRDDLDWTPFYERIPAWRTAADAAPPAFVTANTPIVDAELERLFTEAGVTWQTESIGPYRVFYGFMPADAVPRPPFEFETQ